MKIQCVVGGNHRNVLPLLAAGAQAATLKVYASTAVKAVLEELGSQFEKVTRDILEQNMDDNTPTPYTEITVRISDDLARRLGTVGELERRALEAQALEEFKQGHLTKPELRREFGIGTRMKLDESLNAHGIYEL